MNWTVFLQALGATLAVGIWCIPIVWWFHKTKDSLWRWMLGVFIWMALGVSIIAGLIN